MCMDLKELEIKLLMYSEYDESREGTLFLAQNENTDSFKKKRKDNIK